MISTDAHMDSVLQALLVSEVGREFVRFLENRLSELDKASRRQAMDVVQVQNGRRQELEEIIEVIVTSRDRANARKQAPGWDGNVSG